MLYNIYQLIKILEPDDDWKPAIESNKINENTSQIDGNKLDDFNKMLEINVFVKKMQEIDLLKYLLLEENSIYLFNFITGKTNLFDSNQNSYNYKNKNLQHLIKTSYCEMKENSKISNIDQKLLNLFDNFIDNN